MKQYNRIMLGEHGKYTKDCLEGNYIGANFLKNHDLTDSPFHSEKEWRQMYVQQNLKDYPDKSIGTARTSIGFLWTICFGLKIGDIILAPNGEGCYNVGEITGNYFYVPNSNLPHRRPVTWLNTLIPRQRMSKNLQHSTGSIGTCCNITKYKDELENLIQGTPQNEQHIIPTSPKTPYKERSLHRLLSNWLSGNNILSKTIFHEESKKDQAQKWVHPDMIGVEFNEFQESATRALLKTAETKEYISLYSYELKRYIENDHQLKEYFFQTLSNSSWANYGYLVAFEINEDVMEEMERLNRSFGIGVIQLSPYDNTTTILFPARKNELDYYTIDKLCRINSGFKNFIVKTNKVLNAQSDVLNEVKDGLITFCDKGFENEDEMRAYCSEHNIPLQ